MARHGFGIMKEAPQPNERYDTFEPEKYDCLFVHDDYIEPLLDKLAQIKCYWHTLERPENGLAYCGITLIPPSSMKQLIKILEDATGTKELRDLLLKAQAEDKFVIHYGI